MLQRDPELAFYKINGLVVRVHLRDPDAPVEALRAGQWVSTFVTTEDIERARDRVIVIPDSEVITLPD